MPNFVWSIRRFWGRCIALVALAAACSGRVEERIENGSGGTGGTAISPVGGVGGSLGDRGVGGNFGSAGMYGEFGGSVGAYGVGGTSFGTGGYYGDAGGSFGGTSGGGAGGTRCNPNPFISEKCTPTQSCIDPHSPTPERVALNQTAIVDAGPPDSGTSDSGISDASTRLSDADVPGPVDGGPSDAPNFDGPPSDAGLSPLRADICGGSRLTPNPSYLAFDLWSAPGPTAVGIFSVTQSCSGSMLGIAQLVPSPPPANSWTTQCVQVPNKILDRVLIHPMVSGNFVKNLRFVSDCVCPRPLTIHTNCGPEGLDAGLLCHG
jgi:hypothetical protein